MISFVSLFLETGNLYRMLITDNQKMIKKRYICPACELLPFEPAADLLKTSVTPTGTPGGGGADSSLNPWEEHNPSTGGVGVGGEEYEGDDW